MSPAGWTAVSAIVVAVIGAVATLITAWWQRTPPAPRSVAQPSIAAAPAPRAGPASKVDPAGWAGTWSGAAQAAGEPPFRVEVRIAPNCAVGADCGTISVLPCKGRLTLVEIRGEVAEFSVDRFDERSDPKVCQPGAGETFKAGDGTLDYTATYSGAHGVLKRSQ